MKKIGAIVFEFSLNEFTLRKTQQIKEPGVKRIFFKKVRFQIKGNFFFVSLLQNNRTFGNELFCFKVGYRERFSPEIAETLW